MTILEFGGLLALFLGANFLVFAVGGWWFFYKLLGPTISHRAIHEAAPDTAQIRSEIRNSLLTQVIFWVMGMGLWGLYDAGWTQIYSTWDARGVSYFCLNFVLIQLAHDTYFYWTHRWMHESKWLRKFHLTHHDSHPPTPFAALSFHPVEAVIHGAFWYVVAVLIPSHALWLWAFYIFMFYINMWGHTGYEFWHKDLLDRPLQRLLNTPTHHNLHHKYHTKNFGIYYNVWDTVCGTNHEKYAPEYRTIKQKTETHKTSRLLKVLGL